MLAWPWWVLQCPGPTGLAPGDLQGPAAEQGQVFTQEATLCGVMLQPGDGATCQNFEEMAGLPPPRFTEKKKESSDP